MLEHKGFAAWITIEGKMATEYAPAILQGSEAECWIASEAGKSFEINFRATKPVDESRNVMEHTSAKTHFLAACLLHREEEAFVLRTHPDSHLFDEGVLQAKKIAPRPVRAVPDPSPSTRRLDICDDERYRALQDEVRQLQARIHAISTLLAQTGPKRKRSHVKTEESNEPVPLKKKKVQKIKSEITDKPIMFQPGEVIDLTLDDRIRHR
ncbi:hypothetical protein ONZ45_g15977 [Pleurotus djamor]|nr:hypothetical protein ONZ45_g15977 [Pleurotus djamor]